MDLIGRFKQAKRGSYKEISGMKRNRRRIRIEVEAAYLINNIQKYVRRDHPELLEYVLSDIERLESIKK